MTNEAQVERLTGALTEALGLFESIRVTLVDNLAEPERRAFWAAVQGRDIVADTLTPLKPVETRAAINDRWQPIETAPTDRLVLLLMVMRDGGPVMPGGAPAYDIGWLEDGDWMLSSRLFEPATHIVPSHWMPLPDPPPRLVSTSPLDQISEHP